MNPRLTLTAAAAVILASVSVYPLIQNGEWFWAGVGAVLTAAATGMLTRLRARPATAAAAVLALLAAVPLLTGPAWPEKVLAAVIVATAAASRVRVRILQVLGGLITYGAALLLYLNVTFAPHRSVAGIVPTTTSVRYLWSLAGQGLAERAYAPPVPGTLGLTLVTAAGIGLMAAATDLLAVRLRSPALAGLPLLALYSVRITTNARQGGVGATVVFCLGLIGYLALLAADGRDRLRVWGRLVTVWRSSADELAKAAETPDTRALAASGRRIGLAAACIALVFPLLIPGVRVHDLFASGGSGPGRGEGRINLPNPLVQMNGQLLNSSPQPVLTYHTSAPAPQEQYLQVYVLNYDSDTGTWGLVPPQRSTRVGSGPLRAAPGVASGTPETRSATQVKLATGVTGYSSRLAFLPMPYAPATLHVSGSWLEDDTTLMVYSSSQRLSGLSYTVTSTRPDPGTSELNLAPSYPRSISGNYLGFPAGYHRELAKLATQITKSARTPFAKALALQRYFTSGTYTYSVNVKLPDSAAGLSDFLFRVKQGYCQQFAFAMAALARLVGIPSRIAVGYTAGTREAHGLWKVTTADAHAWPELYFRDVGWLRFEPTPGGAAGLGTATVPNYTGPPGTGISPQTAPLTGVGAGKKSGLPGAPNQVRPHGMGFPGAAGAAQATPRHSILPVLLLAAAIVLGLALITPMSARWLIRRRRLRLLGRPGRPGADPGTRPPGDRNPEAERLAARRRDADLAHAAWAELRDNLADYGLASRASESPRALATRIATTLHLDPASRQALGRVASAEERARYATVPLGPGATLRADSATLRRALSRESGRAQRWRAWLLPASTLTPLRQGLQHMLDLFGWMDAAGLRLRDRMRQQT